MKNDANFRQMHHKDTKQKPIKNTKKSYLLFMNQN